MTAKRIFIVTRHPLFGQGVETLLRQRGCFTILGREQDCDAALKCVETLGVDVVILDTEDKDTGTCALVTRLLALEPQPRVIGISLRDNQLSIFRRERKTVCTVDDLVAAIET